MGVFRPDRKVTSPDNSEWELYVMRYRAPRWQQGDWDGAAEDLALIPLIGAAAMVYDVGQSLWYDIIFPMLRYPVDLAVAVVRGRGGQTVWIEAIRWDVPPRSDRFVWRTTQDHYRRVLNEVASAFARGEVAEPLGATREEPWV